MVAACWSPVNDPAALAGELQALVQDSSRREKLGEAAIEAFRHYFLWSSVRRQYETVIESIAA